MKNFNALFAVQLLLFALFISHVGKLFIHLLINNENETR